MLQIRAILALITISAAINVAAAQTDDAAARLRQRAVDLGQVPSDLIGAAALLDQRLAEIALLTAALERSSVDAAALRAQVEELRAQLPAPPPPQPTAARVNLYAAAPYWAGLMGQTALWTDVQAYTRAEVESFMAAVATRPPGGIGTYLSSCDVVDQVYQDRWPAKTIPAEQIPAPMRFPSNFAEPGRWTVNLRDPSAMRLLGDLIVAEAARRQAGGFEICYLDNVAHPDSGDRRFTWQERCDALAYIRARLPAGVRLIVNVTLPPGYWPTADLLRLASVCDGATFEVALHPTFRGDPIKVRAAIADVRELVRAGMTVIFCPARNRAWSDAQYVAEKQFAAGFALACRERADSRVYAVPGSQPPETPAWMGWAARLGQPLGDNEPGPLSGTLVRRYTGGTLTLRPADASASVTFQ